LREGENARVRDARLQIGAAGGVFRDAAAT